ncbi:MAG: hypothetical protein AB1696_15585 [Planctomycetota bacterium]
MTTCPRCGRFLGGAASYCVCGQRVHHTGDGSIVVPFGIRLSRAVAWILLIAGGTLCLWALVSPKTLPSLPIAKDSVIATTILPLAVLVAFLISAGLVFYYYIGEEWFGTGAWDVRDWLNIPVKVFLTIVFGIYAYRLWPSAASSPGMWRILSLILVLHAVVYVGLVVHIHRTDTRYYDATVNRATLNFIIAAAVSLFFAYSAWPPPEMKSKLAAVLFGLTSLGLFAGSGFIIEFVYEYADENEKQSFWNCLLMGTALGILTFFAWT